jgi:hypothetical protein
MKVVFFSLQTAPAFSIRSFKHCYFKQLVRKIVFVLHDVRLRKANVMEAQHLIAELCHKYDGSELFSGM